MRIETLDVKNFRCFEHLTLDFHPRLNALVGVNGSGKTSLLRAIKLCLGSFVGHFSDIDVSEKQKLYISPEDVRFIGYGAFAPSTSFQCKVVSGKNKYSWSREKVGLRGKTSSKNTKEVEGWVKKIEADLKHPLNNASLILPVIVYFSTDRVSVDRKYQASKDKLFSSRMRGYFNSLGDFTNIEYLKGWFKDRQLAKYQHQDLESPALDLMQKIITKIPDIKGIEYIVATSDIEAESDLYLIYENGERIGFDYLSDGTKMFVAMFTDIAMRCILLNPHKGINANETPGVIMIDEVDLHLHPSWQRMVVPALLDAFPNIQFFITTHSPMVLASLEPYITDPEPNVFLMSKTGIKPIDNELIGTANDWLMEAFNLDEPRSLEAEVAMKEAKKLLSQKEPSTDEISKSSQKLMKHVQAHDPFWVRWNHFAKQHGINL